MRILLGSWFTLPLVGREYFSAMMKQGVKYDKALGFKIDSETEIGPALRTIRAAIGGDVELSLRCFVCVPGGTIVIGDNKEIRRLRPLNRSAGVSGLCTIDRTMSRQYQGKLLRIKASGLLPLEITPEHPMLVSTSITTRSGRHVNRKQTISFSKLHWKEAGALSRKTEGSEGDYLLIPRIPGSYSDTSIALQDFTNVMGRRVCASKHIPLQIPLNVDTAWLFGIYVAEGFPSSTGACFSLNHNEKEIHQRIIDIGKSIGYSPAKQRRATSTVVIISSRILSRALASWCGKGARNKRIPDFLLFHKDQNVLRSMLEGYAAGDGYVSEGVSFMSTSSRVLALQIQLLGARLGEFISINKAKSGQSVIKGRKITGGPDGKYMLELRPRGSQSFARVTERGVLTPIRNIEPVQFKGRVYNLETTDNTYLVSNAVVHNCGKEACPGCAYSTVCDRSAVSPACLCAEHSSGSGAFELYEKTLRETLLS